MKEYFKMLIEGWYFYSQYWEIRRYHAVQGLHTYGLGQWVDIAVTVGGGRCAGAPASTGVVGVTLLASTLRRHQNSQPGHWLGYPLSQTVQFGICAVAIIEEREWGHWHGVRGGVWVWLPGPWQGRNSVWPYAEGIPEFSTIGSMCTYILADWFASLSEEI